MINPAHNRLALGRHAGAGPGRSPFKAGQAKGADAALNRCAWVIGDVDDGSHRRSAGAGLSLKAKAIIVQTLISYAA
jgi:hypothetical protein